jgi:hypothetical protein
MGCDKIIMDHSGADQDFAEYNGIKIGFLNVRGPNKGCKNKHVFQCWVGIFYFKETNG